ncbi:hypothetical protein ABW19_dt0200576 [Dactylella cylindrospora]|nr:hypothetical protein ABW19_dt0200576 [Dactylella cylindrospora]
MLGKLTSAAKKQLSSVQAQVSAAGSSSGSGGAQKVITLEPVSAQIAIFPQFVAQKTESLVLKEKVFSFSGDSFDIKTLEGNPVFKVQGKAMSLSGRKIVADTAGNELFHLRKEHLSIHTTFYGEDASGKKLFEVKSKFSIGSSKAYIIFTDVSGKAHNLLMKGDFFDREAAITDETTGAVVATINRKFFNVGEILGGAQTYVLSVAPGVDTALMTAACICLDEKRNEK